VTWVLESRERLPRVQCDLEYRGYDVYATLCGVIDVERLVGLMSTVDQEKAVAVRNVVVVASKMRGGQGATNSGLMIIFAEELMSILENTTQKSKK